VLLIEELSDQQVLIDSQKILSWFVFYKILPLLVYHIYWYFKKQAY